VPLGRDIATQWATEYGFPLDDHANLIAVSQYVAVMTDPMVPKDKIVRMLESNISAPDWKNDSELHNVLANLPLPVFVTTNYDSFMSQALSKNNKDVRQELCRWNAYLQDAPSAFDGGYVPTVASPVVFHLHGYSPQRESLVLTEDDYLDFLVNMARDDQLIPMPIRKSLSGTSLLFVGYGIADWNFRVLFRSIARYLEGGQRRTHFAVMTPPSASEETKQKAIDYLKKYYENIDVRVYWGTAADFARELRSRWGVSAQ
jgi:hypothetical protein